MDSEAFSEAGSRSGDHLEIGPALHLKSESRNLKADWGAFSLGPDSPIYDFGFRL
jgi:hypothetical protein